MIRVQCFVRHERWQIRNSQNVPFQRARQLVQALFCVGEEFTPVEQAREDNCVHQQHPVQGLGGVGIEVR